jgi:hypothetical protein
MFKNRLRSEVCTKNLSIFVTAMAGADALLCPLPKTVS